MTDAAADKMLSQLRAGLAGRFDVERLLGRGGMGSVFLGRDVTLDRRVAIKVIAPEVATSDILRQRFLQEARTVAKLRHPNIVAVYAAGEADGLLWFAMEYVEGESLRDLLEREGRCDGERGRRILRDLAQALGYAHENGVVHRDVKPENVLLARDGGTALLTDFGVARALESTDGRMTGTGMVLGSPRYMSPEQASGDGTLDGRSDLYSLGLVGYEMFAGRPVVESGTVAAMLVKHLTETPVPLAERTPGTAAAVATAIDRALAKDPAQRWPTGLAMAEALGGLTPSGGTAAAAAARAPRRPVPKAVAFGGTAVAIAASLLTVLLSARGGDGPARGIDPRMSYLVVPFEVQSGDPQVAWLREGSVNMLTLSLGQWQDLQVTDYERTLNLLRDRQLDAATRIPLDDARALARRANAWTLVMGQVSTTPDSLLVTARLYDVASGRALEQTQRGIARTDDPRVAFTAVAKDLLNIAKAPGVDVDIAKTTTTSLEAYRAYLDGVRLLQRWRLREADSAFAVAVARDSTFALAYHKRALGLGWAATSAPLYAASAERAVALSGRLPAREQALVRGHAELARGFVRQAAGQQDSAAAAFRAAQAIYAQLLAKDSLSAEAWYGAADADFHAQEVPWDAAQAAARLTRSLRRFRRTVEIDSSFHLAYAHLVQVYTSATQANSGLVLVGDSLRALASEADVRAVGGPAAVTVLRTQAQAAAIAAGRQWVATDADAAYPRKTLMQAYAAAGQWDSAAAVIREAMRRPETSDPTMPFMVALLEAPRGDRAALASARSAVARMTADSLRTAPLNDRVGTVPALMAVAAMYGDLALADRLAALTLSVDTTFFGVTPLRPILDWSRAIHKVAAGVTTPEVLTAARRATQAMDAAPATAAGMRFQGAAAPYLLALETRDTTWFTMAARWAQQEWPEIAGFRALWRGDTAAARRIALTTPPPDSLRKVPIGNGGIRVLARAQLLAEVGETRRAAETYEALDLRRLTQQTFLMPGLAVWARSFAARARLWEQVGERDRAIAAYDRFADLWQDADPALQPQVRAAREAAARLRESPARKVGG
jgi:serine/threonine-protein kinase